MNRRSSIVFYTFKSLNIKKIKCKIHLKKSGKGANLQFLSSKLSISIKNIVKHF